VVPPGSTLRPNQPPELLAHDSGAYVNSAGVLSERQDDNLVTMWQYLVNAQRVSNYETNTLVYIATMDGRKLLCFRPDPRAKASAAFAYVPHFCTSDPSILLNEMRTRGFVQANDLEPTLVVGV